MPYYHACIFAKYDDVSGVATRWTEKCDSLLVVEHPAEGKTQRIHCHFLIETTSGEDWFRTSAKESMGEYIKRGNYWISTRVQKGEHAGKVISRQLTLVYLVRKNYPIKFAKNFSEEELETARQAWVDSDKNDTSRDTPTEYYTKQLLNKFTYLKLWQDLPEESHEPDRNGYNVTISRYAMLYRKVRSIGMRMYLGMHGNQPPAKVLFVNFTNAVFITLMERIDCLDIAIEIILEKY